MQAFKDFETEIQKIDPRFTILQNPNRPGLCNVFFAGQNYDLPPVPEFIKDEPDDGYRYEFPNGMSARFWSKGEVIGRLEKFAETFEANKELYAD